ncbi:motile sperm domain-containing protein 1-like [Acipenser oxyrinchus oxyrinchus]|uniref:Motile sperm domain-containing protein 3 n=1 Tax=Acipenser oxyrinchus oxyrinchus TaxID=40147 RepID=A0AAD8FRS7_ACIOX|nr:motile sperm domain-containing protein 1-like [Acipenser oxyrinchus oxyrinchus]
MRRRNPEGGGVKEREWGGARRTDSASTSLSAFRNPAGPAPEGKLPVFLFPHELIFFADDQSSHKQVLTLYNPYSFILKFKILCTAPARFTVLDAVGHVKPSSCIDIVIRHRDVSPRHYGQKERFRMEVWEEGGAGRGAAGSKEVCAVLQPARAEASTARAEPTGPAQPRELPDSLVSAHILAVQGRSQTPGFSVLCVLVGVACVAFLMFPLHGDTSTLVPPHFHVTVMQKLVCAYILGLLTMVFLR